MPSEEKNCIDCSVTKPITEFYKSSAFSDGHASRCIPCHKIKVRKIYRENESVREKARARANSWRLNNPERKAELDRKYAEANREKIRSYHQAWFREHGAAYREANRESIRLASHKYSSSDKGKKHRRAQLLRDFGLTLEQFQNLLSGQNGVCAICKQPESAVNPRTKQIKSLSVDHDHETGKVRGLLCQRCNTALGQLKKTAEK